MKFHYRETVAILVNNRIVQTFTNKHVETCCDLILSRYVIEKFGYEYGTFTLMKL